MKNSHPPVRILYIEDDPLLCELFTTVMSAEGYSVETALTGRDGLDRHEAVPFDIVAIDYALPDMMGLDVAREMLARDPELPITFLTGKGSEEVAARAIELGVLNYIIKGDQSVYLKLLPSVIANLNDKRIERIEKRDSEIEVRKTAEHLKSIINNTAEGLVSIDSQGVVETFNPAAEKMFGYSSGEIIGRNVSMLMPEGERSTHDGYVRNSDLHAPRIINKARELYGLRKDGSLFPMELNVSPMHHEGQISFIGIMHDISERKAADLALLKSTNELKEILATTSQGYWRIDNNARTIEMNARMGQILGISPQQAVGTSVSDYLSDEQREIHKGSLRDRIEGKSDAYELVLTTANDVQVPCIFSATPLYDEDGEANGSFALVSDISERVAANEALRLAMVKAESASKAKSEFLSSMSHELRTPLNAILGFGQMLEFNPKEPLTKSQQDCVNQILKGGEHLLELISEILDLAKIESGKVDMSIEDVSLMEVCEECLSLVRILAEERGITIVLPEGEATTLYVKADFTRLRQIMLNLISNAIKYNRDGGSITLAFLETEDGVLRVSVTDTGAGIPEEQHDQLFLPFHRLGAENTDVEGTGIGLIVCKQLVELMNGKIGFQSTPGEGSTFWFELPIADHIASLADMHAQSGLASDTALPETRGTLLYVEDNPANLRLMELIVERIEGMTMISAHTGELGMELARTHRPDIIILDINLPGMDGFEVLKHLRAMPETRDTPVMALSAAATSRDVKKGLEAGFLRYLTKPMKIDTIVEAIHAVSIETGN